MENSEIVAKLTLSVKNLEDKARASWDRYAVPTSFPYAENAANLIGQYQTDNEELKTLRDKAVERLMALELVLNDFNDSKKGFDKEQFENKSIRYDAIARPALNQIEQFLSAVHSLD